MNRNTNYCLPNDKNRLTRTKMLPEVSAPFSSKATSQIQDIKKTQSYFNRTEPCSQQIVNGKTPTARCDWLSVRLHDGAPQLVPGQALVSGSMQDEQALQQHRASI